MSSSIDYDELEKSFECACQDVIGELKTQYQDHYHGTGKLEVFFELIKNQFDNVVDVFSSNQKINGDKEAMRRILSIAKGHAKKCLDFYAKVD